MYIHDYLNFETKKRYMYSKLPDGEVVKDEKLTRRKKYNENNNNINHKKTICLIVKKPLKKVYVRRNKIIGPLKPGDILIIDIADAEKLLKLDGYFEILQL